MMKRKGFTLIEVLVVAVIVAVLAAVAIPAYNGYIKDSKASVAKNTAGTLAASAAAYYSQKQVQPAIADLNVLLPAGFTARISVTAVYVTGNGDTGYTVTDVGTESVAWKAN